MNVRRIARRWFAAPALLMAGVLTLGACGSASNSGSSGYNGPSQITTVASEEPDTLDPQRTNAAIAGFILGAAGDTLVAQDPKGKIVPDLATDWTSNPDGLHWTFNLRKDVTFQNGDPMTAEAVKASFDRAKNPATRPGAVAALLEPVTAVRVTGEHQVAFDLKQAYSPFLTNLSSSNTAIVDAAAAAKMGSQFERAPVLTGAWKITQWQSGQSITLERNDKWRWGPSYMTQHPVAVKTLVFRVITDTQTQISALQNGEAQYQYSIPTAQVPKMQNSPNFNIVSFLRKGLGLYLEFNTTKPPFNDPVLRKAMYYAIDRKPLVQVALQGRGQPACGPLPSTVPGYWKGICDYQPSYNPTKAKELFAQAGWKPGAGGKLMKDGQPFQFTLYNMGTTASWNDSAQLVQQQLAKIGVTMNIQNFEFGTLLAKAQAGEDQAHFMGWTDTSPDILYLLFSSKIGGGGINMSHLNDPQMDSLLEQYRTQLDDGKRNAIIQQIQKREVDDAAQIPLWNNQVYGVASKHMKNFQTDFTGFVIFQNVRLG
jgi:peptide/nickel transport system substrate-binding protein